MSLKRFVPLLLSFMAVSGCSSETSGALDNAVGTLKLPIINGKKVTGNNRFSTVVLYYDYYGQIAAFCTGVLIADKYVLTAGHCVADCGSTTTSELRPYMRIGFGQSVNSLKKNYGWKYVYTFYVRRRYLVQFLDLFQQKRCIRSRPNLNGRINKTADYIEYDTGLAFEVPEGYVMLIFPRSSNSKKDLVLANAVGVLDSTYRGPLKLRFKRQYRAEDWLTYQTVDNTNGQRYELVAERLYSVGDKVGQIMILPYPTVQFEEVDELEDTLRGDGGFGSTGN